MEKTGQPPPYTAGAAMPPPPPQPAMAQQTMYNTPASYGMQGGVQGGPPPPPPVTSQVVVVQQPIRLHSRHPALVTCPHCHQTVTTSTRSEVGTVTWLACGAMILFGFWLGCCLIPFCIPDLQDTYHECPSCRNVIDVYKPM